MKVLLMMNGRSAFYKWFEQRVFHDDDDWFLFSGFWLVDMKEGETKRGKKKKKKKK